MTHVYEEYLERKITFLDSRTRMSLDTDNKSMMGGHTATPHPTHAVDFDGPFLCARVLDRICSPSCYPVHACCMPTWYTNTGQLAPVPSTALAAACRSALWGRLHVLAQTMARRCRLRRHRRVSPDHPSLSFVQTSESPDSPLPCGFEQIGS